jgi:hypothetical protein
MGRYKDVLVDRYKYLNLNMKQRHVKVDFVPNDLEYNSKLYFSDVLPLQMFDLVSQIPVIGN